MQSHFKSLTNIETSFRLVRTFCLCIVLASVLITLGVAYWSFQQVDKARQRVYVLENGKSILLALAQDQNSNRPAEARDHVRTFLRLFFELEPDDEQIQATIRDASYLGDESVARLYRDLREKGYYTQLVQGNVHQKVEIDSVSVDFSQSPYHVRASGRQLLVRASTVTVRRLVAEGYLIDVKRTDNNPHGFQLERFTVLDNHDLNTITREPDLTAVQ